MPTARASPNRQIDTSQMNDSEDLSLSVIDTKFLTILANLADHDTVIDVAELTSQGDGHGGG